MFLIFLFEDKFPSTNSIGILIEKKSDVNQACYNKMTPLHIIMENKKVSSEMVQILLKNKADPNLKESKINKT